MKYRIRIKANLTLVKGVISQNSQVYSMIHGVTDFFWTSPQQSTNYATIVYNMATMLKSSPNKDMKYRLRIKANNTIVKGILPYTFKDIRSRGFCFVTSPLQSTKYVTIVYNMATMLKSITNKTLKQGYEVSITNQS